MYLNASNVIGDRWSGTMVQFFISFPLSLISLPVTIKKISQYTFDTFDTWIFSETLNSAKDEQNKIFINNEGVFTDDNFPVIIKIADILAKTRGNLNQSSLSFPKRLNLVHFWGNQLQYKQCPPIFSRTTLECFLSKFRVTRQKKDLLGPF